MNMYISILSSTSFGESYFDPFGSYYGMTNETPTAHNDYIAFGLAI